jgi:hypothetical protein
VGIGSCNGQIACHEGSGAGTCQYNMVTVPVCAPPTAAPTQSPAANLAGWNNADVTVTWHWTKAADPAYPIDGSNCTTTSTTSGEGTITLTATCADTLAGAPLGSASYTVKVDKTAPTITAPSSAVPFNATGPTGATVDYTSSVTISDTGGSGLASSGCVPASGSFFPIGTTTVTCNAADVAGNSATQVTFQVKVLGAADQVANLYKQVQGAGPGTSLAAKLAAVQGYLKINDKQDACGTLNAFISQVNALKASIGKTLAAQLITEAKQIEAVIGC